MDLLLSIPIVSYLISPSLTSSWSTSLNILFFYMTWSTLVLSHPPLTVHIVGILAIRIIFFLIPSLFTLLFDISLPSLAEGIKHGGRSALPPRHVRALTKLLALVLFNIISMTATEGLLSFAFGCVFKTPEFKTSTTLPLPWQMLKHMLILLASRETLNYYIHRFILHGKSYTSTYHNTFAHSKTSAPFSLQLMADHPLPLLLHRLLPCYLPSILLRPHLLTYLLLVTLCTVEETLAMSGYTIVPGIIMSGIAQRAAIHYAGRGASNFGSWGILDWMLGTSPGRGVLEDVKSEADKHRLDERSVEKADQGVGIVQDSVDTLMEGIRIRSGNTKGNKR